MIKYNNRAKLKKICKTAPFINASQGDNEDMPTHITRQDLDLLVGIVFANKAEPCRSDENEKFGQGVVRDSFFLVIHSDMKNEFTETRTQGFIPVDLYPYPDRALKCEIGAVGNLRVLISDKMYISKNKSINAYNVYHCILFDKNDKCLVLRVTR